MLKWAVTVSVLLTLCAFSLAGYSFTVGHRNACQARNTSLNVMSVILVAAKMQTDADQTVTAAKKLESDAFLNRALEQIKDAEC